MAYFVAQKLWTVDCRKKNWKLCWCMVFIGKFQSNLFLTRTCKIWNGSEVFPWHYDMRFFKKRVNWTLRGWQRIGSYSDVAHVHWRRWPFPIKWVICSFASYISQNPTTSLIYIKCKEFNTEKIFIGSSDSVSTALRIELQVDL